MSHTVEFGLVGPGRAGTAVAEALVRAGWRAATVAGRSPQSRSVVQVAARLGARAVEVGEAGRGVRVVVIATPDGSVSATASALGPALNPQALVVHLAGALGLEVYDDLVARRPDVRVAAVHPLQTLPGEPGDAARLAGAWFAVEGDPHARLIVEAVGGRAFAVTDRALYHAAACVASNHLVALLGQVERLATAASVPVEAFGPLVDTTLANALRMGAAGALTGPVARGDATTVARHLDALPAGERPTYLALAREAARLAGRTGDPGLDALLAEPAAPPAEVRVP